MNKCAMLFLAVLAALAGCSSDSGSAGSGGSAGAGGAGGEGGGDASACASDIESGEVQVFGDPTPLVRSEGVVFDADGSFRIYASKENPGVKNWICTEGHRRGQVVLRTLLAETDLDPEMSIVKIADIPDRDRV